MVSTQLDLSQQIPLQVQENYGQIAVGKYVVQIGSIHGDAQIRLLEEPLKIGTVFGSLALRNITDLQVDMVHGDLSVKSMTGDLR